MDYNEYRRRNSEKSSSKGIIQGEEHGLKKLYGLQEIRAAAALLVALYHMTYIAQENMDYSFLGGVFRFGYCGVDIFFVLSGFVIYYVYSEKMGQQGAGVSFLVKKALRIFPAYWVVLTGLLLVYLFIPSYGLAETRNPVYIVESYLLLPLRNMTYSALSVAWTLRYELLFYLLFSITIFFRRRVAVILLSAWIGISLVNFILGLVGLGTGNFDFNFLFSAYNLEFALGCAAAHLALNTCPGRRISQAAFFGGTAVLFMNAALDSAGLLSLHRFLLYGIPVIFIVYGAGSYELDHRLRCFKPLVYLGNASYSVFLVHLPVISILDKLFWRIGIYQRAGYFAGTVVILSLAVISGCIFYEVIEKNLNRLTAAFSLRKIRPRDSITQ